jgi:hypothetical protein
MYLGRDEHPSKEKKKRTRRRKRSLRWRNIRFSRTMLMSLILWISSTGS